MLKWMILEVHHLPPSSCEVKKTWQFRIVTRFLANYWRWGGVKRQPVRGKHRRSATKLFLSVPKTPTVTEVMNVFPTESMFLTQV
jgi:hypothetical protein